MRSLTLSEYHELRAAEARGWNRHALAEAVRLQNPFVLSELHAALSRLDQGYSERDHDLAQVEPTPLDQILAGLCELYRTGTPDLRQYIRATVDVPHVKRRPMFTTHSRVVFTTHSRAVFTTRDRVMFTTHGRQVLTSGARGGLLRQLGNRFVCR